MKKTFKECLVGIETCLVEALKSVRRVKNDYENQSIDYSEYIELEAVDRYVHSVEAIQKCPAFMKELNNTIIPLYKKKDAEIEDFLRKYKDE